MLNIVGLDWLGTLSNVIMQMEFSLVYCAYKSGYCARKEHPWQLWDTLFQKFHTLSMTYLKFHTIRHQKHVYVLSTLQIIHYYNWLLTNSESGNLKCNFCKKFYPNKRDLRQNIRIQCDREASNERDVKKLGEQRKKKQAIGPHRNTLSS